MGHHLVRMIEIFQPLHLHLGLKNGTRFFSRKVAVFPMVSCNHGGIHKFPSADTGSSWRGCCTMKLRRWGFVGGNLADEQISYQLSQRCVLKMGDTVPKWSFFGGRMIWIWRHPIRQTHMVTLRRQVGYFASVVDPFQICGRHKHSPEEVGNH